MSNENGGHEERPSVPGRENLLAMLGADERETVELSEEEEAALPPYEFNQRQLLVEFDEGGGDYAFELRRARKDEHEAREYASRAIKHSKRIGTETHITTINQYTRGTIAMAKMVSQRVKGYGEDPEEWLFADLILECEDDSYIGRRKSELRLRDLDRRTRESLLTVSDKVPAPHLKFAGEEYFGGRFKLVRPKGRVIVTKNIAREWQVMFQVGVYDQPDGHKSRPTNVVRFFFEDGAVEAISAFDSKAIIGPTVVMEGGDQREERYISVETMDRLFDVGLKRVTGGCVDGQPFSVSDKSHLAAIDFTIKRGAGLLYYNGMSVDRGNSLARSKPTPSNAQEDSTT